MAGRSGVPAAAEAGGSPPGNPTRKLTGSLTIRVLYLGALMLVVPILAWNGAVQEINAGVGDVLLRLRPPPASPALANIVLVAIDDGTAARYGPLPLNRSTLAAGLRRLAQFRPRVLALDLLLSESTRADDDQALAGALNQFPAVVLGAALRNDAEAQSRWILPLSQFMAPHAVGHVHTEPDVDGVVRSVLLVKTSRNERLWNFGLEVAAALESGRPLEMHDSVKLGEVQIPSPENADPASPIRALTINYAGPEGTFRRIAFSALLNNEAQPADFRDKVVIVGVTAQGSGDRLFTPLSSGIGMSGIEIQANIVRTILDRAFLSPLDPPGEMAGFLVIAGACALGAGRLRRTPLLLALLALGIGIAGGSAVALRFGELWPLGAFLTVFLAASAISVSGEYAAATLGLRLAEQRSRDSALRVQAIAHEIKTPLTAIQGSSEMISQRLVPEEQRVKMAGLICKESKRLTEIIQTFLDVERMAAGTLSIRKQPVDLRALCEEVLERARLYAGRKRVAITADVPPVPLAADPDLLPFAIYNLLTNAVKYSPRQTTVSLTAREKGGAISITVADQGPGIAPAEQNRIFERFYRLQRDRTGQEEGSGIGLALVREIVTQHGGWVEVQSREGAGSRFTIVLPKETA